MFNFGHVGLIVVRVVLPRFVVVILSIPITYYMKTGKIVYEYYISTNMFSLSDSYYITYYMEIDKIVYQYHIKLIYLVHQIAVILLFLVR